MSDRPAPARYRRICWDGCVKRIIGDYEVKTIASWGVCEFCGERRICGYVYRDAKIELAPLPGAGYT